MRLKSTALGTTRSWAGLLSDEGIDRIHQLVATEGVADMLEKPLRQRTLAMLDPLSVSRQGDNRDRASLRIRLEPAVDFPAIDTEPAEVDIQKDQVGMLGGR